MRSMTALFLSILVALLPWSEAAAKPKEPQRATANLFAGTTRDPYQLALQATIWGYPLVRAAQLREKATQPDNPFAPRPSTVATAPINQLGRAKALSDHDTRIGVAPNNDTLYVLTFIDTAAGPFKLETPDFADRYYAFQFGEADSSTLHTYGQRTHGPKLPPVFIVSPDYHGAKPRGALLVRSTQRYLMVAGRILVTDPRDLPRASALADSIRLHKWLGRGKLVDPPLTAQRPLGAEAGQIADDLRLLADLGTVLRDWRPSPAEVRLVRSFGRIGLTPAAGFRPARLSTTERAAVAQGIHDGLDLVRAKTRDLGITANGWSTSYAGSIFGTDYLLRAAVAMDQIYVVNREEALYPVAHVDRDGKPLDGRKSYVICFTRDQMPPVNAFWSITMYYAKGFLVPNAMHRYSIGDRTPGLVYGPDGSLKIVVQNESPGQDRESNWLPAPPEGFMLMMRLYRPGPAILDRTWQPPAIVPADRAPGSCAGR